MPLLVIFLVVKDSVLVLFHVPPALTITFLNSLVPVLLVKVIVPEIEVFPVTFRDAAPMVRLAEPREIPVEEMLPPLIETVPEGMEKLPKELKLPEPDIELVPDISKLETMSVLFNVMDAEPSIDTAPAWAKALIDIT